MRGLIKKKRMRVFASFFFDRPVTGTVSNFSIHGQHHVSPVCFIKIFEKSCTALEGVVQSARLPGPCRSGGTGRRKGLKIPRA